MSAAGTREAQDFPDKQIVTVTYSGTIDNVYNGLSIISWTKHVEWSLRWTGTVRELNRGDAVFTVVKLKGAIAAKFAGSGLGTCGATLKKAPKARVLVHGGTSPDGRILAASAVAPITSQYLTSTSEAELACGTTAALGGIYGGSPALSPRVELRSGSARGSITKDFNASYNGPGGGGGRERDTLKSTLAMRLRAGSPPTESNTPTTPEAVRRLARSALQRMLVSALYPCITAGAGAVLFSGGSPAIGPVVGGTMTVLGTPLCARLIRAIRDLARTIEDPPEPNYARVAPVRWSARPKLPLSRCNQSAAANRSFCVRLHAAARVYLTAVQKTADVARTLAVTVGRESAAAAANDKAALAKQRKAALALRPRLRSALAAQRSAGGALAGALRAGGVRGVLTKAQSSKAIGVVLRRLAAVGVSKAQARRLGGRAIKPASRNVLSVLAGRSGR